MTECQEYICTECGASAPDLYKVYSAEVIKMSRCAQCGEIVDKYVECDNVLLGLDLLLHKLAAYRHLIYNTCTDLQHIARLSVLLILCESYILWIQNKDFIKDSQDGRLYFTAAMELDFYVNLVSVSLRLTLFFAILTIVELCICRVQILHLLKMVILLGFGRVLLVPVITWRPLTSSDVYGTACSAVTFTTCYQGLRALTGMRVLPALLEALLACALSAVLSNQGTLALVDALSMSIMKPAAPQPPPVLSFSFAQ